MIIRNLSQFQQSAGYIGRQASCFIISSFVFISQSNWVQLKCYSSYHWLLYGIKCNNPCESTIGNMSIPLGPIFAHLVNIKMLHYWLPSIHWSPYNTLRLRQHGRHFTDVIFKGIFLNENAWIDIEIQAKTTARWDEKHLSFGIWCALY